jgi:uncharacterized protein
MIHGIRLGLKVLGDRSRTNVIVFNEQVSHRVTCEDMISLWKKHEKEDPERKFAVDLVYSNAPTSHDMFGRKMSIRGFLLCSILGLFIISASVSGLAQSYVPERGQTMMKVAPVVHLKATGIDLRDVSLLEGSPFKIAMTKDSAYLLLLNPDRLLNRFRRNAGLPEKGEVYGGWESEGLSGHTLGHYLSACSMFYASTGEPEFKKRVDYIVDQLAQCQAARRTGYVGAIPNEDSIFGRVAHGDIHSSGFDLNGGWSPWYTVHKVMAGLVDAYLYCDNVLALNVVLGMADWVEATLRTITDEQRLRMLDCEYGGMNEVLANIYALTDNKSYLDLSFKFHDDVILGKLAQRIDPMPGKHSNTNVPKAIGVARRYELTGLESDRTIAEFFWSTMVHNHTYVIGGNSNYEYCGQPRRLSDRLSDNTCETCNTYNMLKLTRHLFCWNPIREYADYYERALYNHILASQNPRNGMMCYFLPLRMGARKSFSDEFNTFTCCVGSGMENHSKYAESIYYEADDGGLYVNLFIPSELRWKKNGTTVRMVTRFPESDTVRIAVNAKKPVNFPLYVREPSWVAQQMRFFINGKATSSKIEANGYHALTRTWRNGDIIEFVVPMAIHTESMPDNPDRIAFLYGPIVLAGQLGSTMPDPVYGAPVLVTGNRTPGAWLKQQIGKPLTFAMLGVGRPFDPILKPLFSTNDQYYSVYFDFFSDKDWQLLQQEYAGEQRRAKEIAEATIDDFRIGEMQPERDHNLRASEKSYVDPALGRPGREARKDNYFDFEMKVVPGENNALLLTYIGDDRDRLFDIRIDSKFLTTVDWLGGNTGRFYDVEYPLPDSLLAGKTKIVVRIEANHGKTAGRIFGARTIRKREE